MNSSIISNDFYNYIKKVLFAKNQKLLIIYLIKF